MQLIVLTILDVISVGIFVATLVVVLVAIMIPLVIPISVAILVAILVITFVAMTLVAIVVAILVENWFPSLSLIRCSLGRGIGCDLASVKIAMLVAV